MPGKPIIAQQGPKPGMPRGPNLEWGPGKGSRKGNGKGAGKGNGKGGGKGKGKGSPNSGCSCCGAKSHTKADCKLNDKVCNLCGKTGHIAQVCRSGQPSNAQAKAASTTDFEAEMARRGYTVTAAPPPPPSEDGHSASTISKKSKAKDAAKIAFDKAVAKKAQAMEAVAKSNDEVTKTSMALLIAEQEYKDEVAATHFASSPPATKPPALDVQQFLDARSSEDIT